MNKEKDLYFQMWYNVNMEELKIDFKLKFILR